MSAGKETRPWSIVAFERLFLGALLIGAIHSAAKWDELVAMASPAFVLAVQVLTFGLVLLLVLLVSRKRSNIAKWINVGLFVLGLPMLGAQFRSGLALGWPLVTIGQSVIQAIALALLFSPSARDWLNSGRARQKAAQELEQTFD